MLEFGSLSLIPAWLPLLGIGVPGGSDRQAQLQQFSTRSNAISAEMVLGPSLAMTRNKKRLETIIRSRF